MYSPEALYAMKRRKAAEGATGVFKDLFEHHAQAAERRVIEDRDPVLREANRQADEAQREQSRESWRRINESLDFMGKVAGIGRIQDKIAGMFKLPDLSLEQRIHWARLACLSLDAQMSDFVELRRLEGEARALRLMEAERKRQRRAERTKRQERDRRTARQERARLHGLLQEVRPPTDLLTLNLHCPHGPDLSGVPLAA